MPHAAVHVFMAMSLDGCIAGADHDLSFLEPPAQPGPLAPDPLAIDFGGFMAGIDILVMGRTTFDVVHAMDVPWPYGDTPVHVVTRRPLPQDAPASVVAVAGPIESCLDAAQLQCKEGGVYLDGGSLIQQALQADRVDTLCLTLVPVVLGEGVKLFDHLTRRTNWTFTDHRTAPGGLVQISAQRSDRT